MIEIQDVTMDFDAAGNPVRALSALSLGVRDDEFLTIVGRSGCGKSTLLRLIAGLITPSYGRVVIDGVEVTEPHSDVGYVFQSPVLLPWRRVIDNVLFSVEMLGRPRSEYRSRASDLLKMAGLSDFIDRYPRELSGGMQQRVAICRALIHDPEVLLMDEPFGALDAMTREEMGVALAGIWERARKTVVFVTHSIPEAILMGDRVIVMTPHPGRLAKVVDINLPRPRTIEMEADEVFQGYAKEIRSTIFAGATA